MIEIGKIKFLWKDGDSRTGGCPGLHIVEEGPEGYVVVGKNTNPALRAQISEISDDETAVFVPANVLDRLRDR
jgi:hypothetical protein